MCVQILDQRCIPVFLPYLHIGVEQQVILVVGELGKGTVIPLGKAEILFEHQHRNIGKFLQEHLHASVGGGIVCHDDIAHAVFQHRGQIPAHHVRTVPVQYDDGKFLHLFPFNQRG